MRKKFLMIDGNSIMHRAYHALPALSHNGQTTNAVYGFLSMLFHVILSDNPEYIGVAFDVSKHVFRHQLFSDYKAGRKSMDDELRSQFPLIKDILTQMGIPLLEREGFEADDIIGSLCNTFRQVDTYVLTGDKDALQLVDEDTFVLLMRKGISDIERFDIAHFQQVYGVNPSQFVDVKAFMGDTSDNIPGVPGVGQKTALKLIAQYGSLEGVYHHLDELKGKQKENLANHVKLAEMSKELSRIVCDMAIDQPLSAFSFQREDVAKCFSQLKDLGMQSLIARMEKGKAGAAVMTTDSPAAKDPALQPPQYEQVKQITQLSQLQEELSSLKEQPLAFYVHGNELQLSFANTHLQLVFDHTFFGDGLQEQQVMDVLSPYLKHNPVTVHDSKDVYRCAAAYGIDQINIVFDVTLAAYIIDANEKDYALSHLALKYLGEEKERAQALFYLQERLSTLLGDGEKVYREIELPLAHVLFHMEEAGFALDVQVLRHLSKTYSDKLNILAEEIYRYAGHEFNILSPKQLSIVLFEELKLTAGKKTKTGYSTSADVLEKLYDDHPIVPRLLEYRKLSKLIGTYLDGMIPLADAGGRVHTRFLQTGASTGRISSKEPNLQNIPVRTEEGREIRKAFIAQEKCTLVTADYSQIELRVLAHLSQDTLLMDAFQKGQDIHARTASEVFGVSLDQVTREMRRSAKAVNFGIVYGISYFGLSRNLGISMSLAKSYIDRYLEKYSGVKRYMDEIVVKAKEDGYVETMLGRKRYIPQLKARNRNVVAFGERIALNAPIQGTSADMIKLAMIRVFNRLIGTNSRLVLQVHDELLIEAADEEAQAVGRMVKEEMENVLTLSIPVVVDVGYGHSWFDAK